MENTSVKQKGKTQADKASKIREAYIDYLLENGKEPPSIYKFAKTLKITEGEFYGFYNSFTAIDKEIWKGFLDETLGKIQSETVYHEYSVREKLLAFYYTLIEGLKNYRSYVVFTLFDKTNRGNTYRPARVDVLSSFRRSFYDFVNELISEGKETNEIVDRPLISNNYDDGLWRQLLFVLNFWVKDDSKSFEQTDVAIEKAINLSFDIMGRSALDTAVDLARFLFQRRQH